MRATPWQFPIASANINVWSSALWLARGITVQHSFFPYFLIPVAKGHGNGSTGWRMLEGKLAALKLKRWCWMLDDVLKESPVWVLFLVSEAELGKWLNWLKLACWKMEPETREQKSMSQVLPWNIYWKNEKLVDEKVLDSSLLIWLARGLRNSEKWLTCFTCAQNLLWDRSFLCTQQSILLLFSLVFRELWAALQPSGSAAETEALQEWIAHLSWP